MNLQTQHIFILAAVLVCLVFSVAMASFAFYTNGGYGFPLDDSWIHLQFAQNLADYGSFSYYKDEMVTSGSTAPLYTLLLAAGLFMIKNEMMLSYALGVLFYLLAVACFFRLTAHLIPGKIYAFAGALLFGLEPRLHWIALSGMETTLFVLLSLSTYLYYGMKKPIALGLSAGLLLWTRPEAIILLGAILADFGYRLWIEKKEASETNPPEGLRWMTKGAIILAILGIAYVAFNFSLSGSFLPNTYAAKLKYYSGGTGNFPMEVFRYVTGGHMIVLSVFSAIGVVYAVIRIFLRKPSGGLIPLLFTSGMFLAYWIKLPYLYQNGRYLMPVLPFVLVLGLIGLDWFVTKGLTLLRISLQESGINALRFGVIAILAALFAYGTWQERLLYQDYCKYISDRQVRTAHWIRENLPEDAIVATHDVGALAYYSNRRIVDMVGLISPEMIERIGDLNKLEEFLISNNVTHVALLRNWFELVNINPLFQTNESTPEIMEVFSFDPERARFTSGQVAWLTSTGWAHLAQGDLGRGGPLLERAVQLDPQSSRAHHHLGWAFMMAGQLDRSEEEFRKAIELHPDYWQAYFALAQVPLRNNQPQEALHRLERLVERNPKMLAAYQSMAQIYSEIGDTSRARVSLETFRRMIEEEKQR